MSGARSMIRRYRADDLEAVMIAWRRANALAHPFLTDTYVVQLEREVRDLYVPKAETYVLEHDASVVGFISLLENEIGGLFLDPSRHGRGHGRALVDHAFGIKGPLTVTVFAENEIGRRFYRAYGFEFVGEQLHAPSSCIIHKMAMTPVATPAS